MADISGRPPRAKTLTLLILSLVVAGVLAAGFLLPVVGGIGLVAKHYADKFENTTCNLQESKPPQKTTLYAKDGKTVIATLFNEDRVPIPISQIPKYLQDALIATEDRRFYSNHGVDLRGVIRSLISNTSGGDTQGGSTLTMQYVKQIRYYQAGDDKAKQEAAISQNINRKIEDAKCALYIEDTLHETKSQILDNYLNISFFGEHSYGIQTAAETYFGKPASQLTLPESALLVGLLRAPSAYDPYLHRQEAQARRNQVLQNLVDVGKLSQSKANSLMAQPIALATKSPPLVRQGCANASGQVKNAAFFCDYVVQWLENVDKISSSQLQTGGLKVVTTLDPRLQNSMQKQIWKAIPAASPMTAVMPVVDPKTGDILAMATSKRYGSKGPGETEQPVFTSNIAQGASTFKLFPLLTALSTGVPTDWPIYTVGNVGSYATKECLTQSSASNGDDNVAYDATETLTTAIAKSSNTYFTALADHLLGCHLQPMVDLAQKLGMTSLNEPSDLRGQTVAQAVVNKERAQQFVLGSINANPLELAGAYAAVANEGKFNTPAPVLSVTDSNHSALPVDRAPGVQVVAPQVADEAATLLQGDTQPFGTSASVFQSWYAANPSASLIAGKTGTMSATNSRGKPIDKNAAIWFVGMTPDYVGATELVDIDRSSAASRGLPGKATGAAYGDYASGIWLKAMQSTISGRTWTWPDPNSAPGIPVPSVVGDDLDSAKQTLADAGFKMRQLDAADNVACPSTVSPGLVAYYGPTIAERGATITVCPSLGVAQPLPPPPPKPVIHHPTGGNSGHGGGGGGNGHGGGGGTGGGGHGGGGGGGGGGGHGGGGGPTH